MALAQRSVRLSTKQSNELSKTRCSVGEYEEKRGAQSSVGFLTPFTSASSAMTSWCSRYMADSISVAGNREQLEKNLKLCARKGPS
jgi:hypothetical protein